ncbi:MAG: HRDC domain-containing protein [Planctomycetia bacterium]|nr:HRDC domain-containing protein [Planctomycetia bacterium]
MPHQTISKTSDLKTWCSEMRDVEWIALDTEFIAERYYQPLLCLIQVATPRGNFLIDPLVIFDTTPFWTLLCDGEQETIVHAGRVELEFCHRHTGRFPKRVFDTQLAGGLVTNEFPAGYTHLVQHFLKMHVPGTESRTDWKCRPLTERQVDYALDDIRYLQPMREAIGKELEALGRVAWLEDETRNAMKHVASLVCDQRWRRLLGSGRYDAHELAIVRALWEWRENVAKSRNCVVRRVLRDDLILELARRKTSEISGIRNIRGMEREDLKRQLPDIARCVAGALALPEKKCPEVFPVHAGAKLSVLGTLFSSVLGTLCREQKIAQALVGTPSDVRDWLAWRLGQTTSPEKPALAQGWRAGVVGDLFEDLLTGRRGIRICEPLEDCPMDFPEIPQ